MTGSFYLIKKTRGHEDDKRGCIKRNPISVIDTTESSDYGGKLGQRTDRHEIVFGRWAYEGSLMPDDALVRGLNSAGDTMDGSGRRSWRR